MDISGKFGEITITENGDRDPGNYQLYNCRDGEFKQVCNLVFPDDANDDANDTNACTGNEDIQWPCTKKDKTGDCKTDSIPKDRPKCGFKNDLCEDKDSQHVIVILVILFVVLFVAMILVFILFK